MKSTCCWAYLMDKPTSVSYLCPLTALLFLAEHKTYFFFPHKDQFQTISDIDPETSGHSWPLMAEGQPGHAAGLSKLPWVLWDKQ